MKREVVCILLSLVAFIHADDIDRSIEKFGLKGHIKSLLIEESYFSGKEGNRKEDREKSEHIFYDPSGLVTEVAVYKTVQGPTEFHMKYFYNDKSLKVQEKWYFKKEKTPYYINNLSYNKEGKVEKEEIEANYDVFDIIKKEYTYTENHVEITLTNRENKKEKKYTEVYDSEGRLIEYITTYLVSGRSRSKVWKYDEKGNLVEKLEINEKGKNVFHNAYSYNDKGQKTGETSDSFGQKTDYTYEYDAGGLLKKQISTRKSKLLSVKVYTYNDKGLLIEELRTDIDKAPLGKVTYQYDSHDNMTATMQYEYKTPKGKKGYFREFRGEYRTIEYYE
ncbi:MAG: hypothetical protein JW969_09600 [Spirochaetales bacterium]|nr:hypothetical protein [Spirochaetales bacterium]